MRVLRDISSMYPCAPNAKTCLGGIWGILTCSREKDEMGKGKEEKAEHQEHRVRTATEEKRRLVGSLAKACEDSLTYANPSAG